MQFIVDLQGFQKSKNDFIAKEVAILGVQEGSIPLVFTFKSPTQWSKLPIDEQCAARWLEQNFHGISWSSGKIPYEQLSVVLGKYLKSAEKVYTKGLQKQKFLQKLLSYK